MSHSDTIVAQATAPGRGGKSTGYNDEDEPDQGGNSDDNAPSPPKKTTASTQGLVLTDCDRLSAFYVADDIEPILGVGGGMRLECQLRVARQLAAHCLAAILALNVEFVSVGRADDGVGQVDAQFGNGVLAEVVAVLELVGLPDGILRRHTLQVHPRVQGQRQLPQGPRSRTEHLPARRHHRRAQRRQIQH